MAAGTVISGGFPGRVAQEVQPNPKCNGCLHYDGQAGRTGACTIGLRPWLCGDGEAADIGYAPLVRGAGTYLPGMSNRSAQAPEVGKFDLPELYGSGSHRPVTFQQVSLGEEHVHFVKSMVSQHTTLQKSMCRLCQSSSMIGTAPANVGYQICTCAPIEARTVAKSLMQKLNNLERSVIDIDDLVAFVYDASKANFDPRMMKGTFYHAHGKYEVSPAGGGSHHVDFHPRGGGPPARVGTYGSPKEARRATQTHATRFAQGSTPQQTEAAAQHIAPGWHALAGERHAAGSPSQSSEVKTGIHTPKARSKSDVGKGDGPIAGGITTTPKTSDAGSQGRVSMRGVEQAQAQAKKPAAPAPAPAPKQPQVASKSEDLGDWDWKSVVSKGPRRQSVATAPEVPTTEKPYQTRFKRPNDSAKPESPKPSSGFNIDTSKLRAAGERHASKLMQQNTPRGTEDRGAKVGREAFASRTEHKAPSPKVGPSPNRPGQNRPEFGGGGPKPAAQVASKPAAPKHIDMEEGMSEADKRVGSSPKVTPSPQVPSMSTMPKKEERSMPRVAYGKSLDQVIGEIEAIVKGEGDEEGDVEKAIDHAKHSHIVTGPYAGSGRGYSSSRMAHNAADKLDNKYGAYRHTVAKNPHYKPDTSTPTGSWKEKYPGGAVAAFKSLDALLEELHNEEDVEKSLRWSHKAPGEAKTSHGKYTVAAAEGGGHTVTYHHKESGKSYAKTFATHREALGAVTEHHLKNRPPPKPRKKKDPNAPKAPKGAPAGGCPPCP